MVCERVKFYSVAGYFLTGKGPIELLTNFKAL
jgi:hypothetical protein